MRHPALAVLPGLALLAAPVPAQVINEFVGNHTGSDDYEYVELFGAPSTSYTNLTVVQIEGDSGSDAGRVNVVLPVGVTDSSGLWWSGFLNDPTDHNDSYAYFLVSGFTGSLGQDLDAGDDGTLDQTPWTAILDSVAVDDGDAGDHFYGAQTVLAT